MQEAAGVKALSLKRLLAYKAQEHTAHAAFAKRTALQDPLMCEKEAMKDVALLLGTYAVPIFLGCLRK